jgi:hypothetical protein
MEQQAKEMVVDEEGGGTVKMVDDAVARGGASDGGSTLVLHDKPAGASADSLFAAYRKDLLARNTGAVEKLDEMERSVVVSIFAFSFALNFGGVVLECRAD